MGQGNIRKRRTMPHSLLPLSRQSHSSPPTLHGFFYPEGQAASRGDVGKVPQKQVLKV